jgi:hypothetical protein
MYYEDVEGGKTLSASIAPQLKKRVDKISIK